jgi:hypothetical protein
VDVVAATRLIPLSLFVAAGCSTLLGIGPYLESEELPSDSGSPARACSVAREACSGACEIALCEDFEALDGGLPAWSANLGFANPFRLGNATVTTGPGGVDNSRALDFNLSGTSGNSVAQVFHQVWRDRTDVKAVEYAFDLKLENVQTSPDGGSTEALLVGVLGPLPGADGPGMAFRSNGLEITYVGNLYSAAGPTIYVSNNFTASLPFSQLVGSFLHLTLFAGASSLGTSRGYPGCPPGDVFGAAFGPAKVCLAVPRETSVKAVLANPSIVLGAVIRGAGAMRLRYDNVVVYALR